MSCCLNCFPADLSVLVGFAQISFFFSIKIKTFGAVKLHASALRLGFNKSSSLLVVLECPERRDGVDLLAIVPFSLYR